MKGSIRAPSGISVEYNILSSLQPSFLLLAASHSLLRYGYQTLQARSEQLGAELVPCLLSYCVLSIPERIGNDDEWHKTNTTLDFITKILDRGGVSTDFWITDDFTPWTMFLWRMHNIKYTSDYDQSYDENNNALQSAMVRTVLAFLKNNSDLQYQGIFDIYFGLSKSYLPTGRAPIRHPFYTFRLALSALSLIESCLRGRSELEFIKELCNSRGAPHYSECLQFEVHAWNDGEVGIYLGIIPSAFVPCLGGET